MSTSNYRPLKALIFADHTPPPLSIGKCPELRMIDLDLLVVDDRYQRAIGKNGRPSVKAILAKFDWRKFGIVIVTKATTEDGAPVFADNGKQMFAIIDGQHRSTAAYMHPAVFQVPCLVVDVPPAEAASIFAAVNGQVTAITPQQLFKARSMAGEPAAKALQKVLDAADVRVLAYKTPEMTYKKGDTLAIGTLERCLRLYGPEILTVALQAITQTGDGNAGCVKATLIQALCEMIKRVPEWQEAPTILFDLVDEISLSRLIDDTAAASRYEKKPQRLVMLEKLPAMMGVKLRAAAAKAVVYAPTQAVAKKG